MKIPPKRRATAADLAAVVVPSFTKSRIGSYRSRNPIACAATEAEALDAYRTILGALEDARAALTRATGRARFGRLHELGERIADKRGAADRVRACDETEQAAWAQLIELWPGVDHEIINPFLDQESVTRK